MNRILRWLVRSAPPVVEVCFGRAAVLAVFALATGVAFAQSSSDSGTDLRKWLQELKKHPTRAPSQPPVAADRAVVPAAPVSMGPVNERLLARCSQRFLDCANGNAAAMDDCVAKSPCFDPEISAGTMAP